MGGFEQTQRLGTSARGPPHATSARRRLGDELSRTPRTLPLGRARSPWGEAVAGRLAVVAVAAAQSEVSGFACGSVESRSCQRAGGRLLLKPRVVRPNSPKVSGQQGRRGRMHRLKRGQQPRALVSSRSRARSRPHRPARTVRVRAARLTARQAVPRTRRGRAADDTRPGRQR